MKYKVTNVTTSTVCHIKNKTNLSLNHRSYANLNKWVFMRALKLSTISVCLISRGNSFHNLELHVEKALSPYFLALAFGCSHLCCWSEWRDLVGTYGWSRSAMYTGVLSVWDLNANRSILYWMRYLTGQQWRAMRVWEVWSGFLFWAITLAALFWISCNLLMR